MKSKLLVGILLFAAIFAFAFTEAVDPDFGWHLKTGEYIVSQHTIPTRDIFSFTAQNQPWITEEWLTEVAMYLLFRSAGYFGVIAFFALVSAASLLLVYWRSDAHPLVAGAATLFGAWVLSAYWGARPQMISVLFASIFIFILERYRREGAGRFLYWLVLISVIWANAHGGFATGIVLILVYLLAGLVNTIATWDGNRTRLTNLGELASILFMCVFVIIFNPNTYHLYAYPFQTLFSPVIQTVVVEWQPPDLANPTALPFVIFFTILLTALLGSHRRFGLVEILLILGLTLASLRATRQIPLWTLVAVPILASSAADALRSISWEHFAKLGGLLARGARIGFAMGVVALVAVNYLRIDSVLANQQNAEAVYFPDKAVQYIQANNLHGPIFNRYEWGGYLIWKMFPKEKVFIDGRTDVYGLSDTFFYRMYAGLYNAGPNLSETLSNYRIQLVLVDINAPIAEMLDKDSQWKKAYTDNLAVIYTRK